MRTLLRTGQWVEVLSVDADQAMHYTKGKKYQVLVDYEDLIYLEGPNDIYFYPSQLKVL